MDQKVKWTGPGESTYDYLISINDRGSDYLVQVRDQENVRRGDGHRRNERTWGANQAAEMIGRSVSWLRETDVGVPRNEAGHGRWTLERINSLREQAGTLYKRPEGSDAFVLAMAKFKGGVGNTTNTLHLAHGLAMKGLKVLVWDWDAQHSFTQIGGGIVADLELDEEDLPMEVMLRNPTAILGESEIVRGTYFHNVDLLPASSALNDLELQLIAQYQSHDESQSPDLCPPEYRMKAVLDLIKNNYDVVLIDCPPTLGMNTMNGLLAADGLITSLRPDLPDMASLVAFTDGLAGLVENHEKEFSYFRILISQHLDNVMRESGVENSAAGHRQSEIDLRRLYGDAVMSSVMYHSKEISHAASQMSTVLANEKPIGARPTYKRALSIVQNVVNEVYNDLIYMWEQNNGANDD